jgi:hypothetical protein
MFDNNTNLVIGPRRGPDTKTDRPTDCRSQNNLNLNSSSVAQCPRVQLGYPIPVGYKYRNLALHVGGVSKIETIKHISNGMTRSPTRVETFSSNNPWTQFDV